MKYPELIACIKKGALRPLYLIHGEEDYLIQEAVRLITEKAIDPGARDFNFNAVYARDMPGLELVNLCQTLPFMSEMRLVIVKDLDAYKAADLEHMVPYLNDPSPSTCLVMLSNQGRFEKKAVISAVEAHGVVTRVFQLRDNEIVNWVISKAKEKGLAFPADAAQLLWQIIGSDLQKLVNELEKIGIYLKDRKAVSFDDVKAVAGDFREYTSFDLANAVGAKNREKALLILFRLVQEGEAPVGLLASIAWHFRRLTIVKSLEREGVHSDEAMKKLRPPVIFHQVAQFKEQVRRYTLDELRDVFEALLSADRMLKSSSMSGRLVLERMILRMCGL
jgi:DNA polymerase-3 subunit delta